MLHAERMWVGCSKQNELGALETQCVGHIGYSLDDVPHFQCLGVSAMPYQADDGNTDSAEAIVLRGDGCGDGVIIGMRDARTTDITGNMKPGDTVVHSTGPHKAAQLQLKEETRQACLITQSRRSKRHMGVFLDGEEDTITINCGSAGTIHISKANGMVLTDQKGRASIQLCNGQVIITGEAVILGGRVPVMPLAMVPPGTVPTVPPAPPNLTTAAQGVWIGK